jgi:hypothetical protein
MPRKPLKTPKRRRSNLTKLRRKLGAIPFGYSVCAHDPKLLNPIYSQLEALEQAYQYLRHSSYREVARWLTQKTGRPISGPGLHQLVRRERKRQEVMAKAARFQTLHEY